MSDARISFSNDFISCWNEVGLPCFYFDISQAFMQAPLEEYIHIYVTALGVW